MSNGDLVRELQEQAEKGTLSTKASIPLMLNALAQTLDGQAQMGKEVRELKEAINKNPMVRLGRAIEEKPKTVLFFTVLVMVALDIAGPLLLEFISNIP